MMHSVDEDLDALADDFLSAWQTAHGFAGGQARALVGPDRLAILVEGAFSLAELKLAEQQRGGELLRHYAYELLQDIRDQMSDRIFDVLSQPVLSGCVNVNPDSDQVMFVYRLGNIQKNEEPAG